MKSTTSMGPDPVLISRTQADALYTILEAVTKALTKLEVPWIVTGGSLLGSVRQHSILFTDDDVDLAIIGPDNYELVATRLQSMLGTEFSYSRNVWEGGDRVRLKKVSNVFLDVFQIREYANEQELKTSIGTKANGCLQSEEYTENILATIRDAAFSQGEKAPLYPCYHFTKRKAVELWPKEVYRAYELFPIQTDYEMGPVHGIAGPRTPVLLLKRAFGRDCFEVYFQSHGHNQQQPDQNPQQSCDDADQKLPPRIQPGGLWEQSPKTTLLPEHFIPMQPVPRARRRPTNHNWEALQRYLEAQSSDESRWMEEHQQPRKRTVYMDGVFDLFHVGHLRAIEQCAALGDRVVLGVTGDADAASYKRPPIISQNDRVSVLRGLSCVDEIVCPCPLIVTQQFMMEHDIDLVVHGFADEDDVKQQDEFFNEPIRLGKFKRIEYYDKLSTSDIIEKIQGDINPDLGLDKIKWFGSSIRAVTNGAQVLQIDTIKNCIESHIEKSRQQRSRIIRQIEETNAITSGELQALLRPFARESYFGFDTSSFPLRDALLRATRLSLDTDLSQLHLNPKAKYEMLQALTENFSEFQHTMSEFILKVCACHFEDAEEIYYQAFPCLRVIQPGDFSIGPHSDIAYGHHPASVNFYVPLTPIFGTASLYMESAAGAEDWHPIVGNYGTVKVFPGATCMHWTPENTTDFSRVSLDVRLIEGQAFRSLRFPGDETLRKNPGYYCRCKRSPSGEWVRDGELVRPDARMGFPWTVRDWEAVKKKRTLHS